MIKQQIAILNVGAAILSLVVVGLSGCNRGPAAIPVPNIDPATASLQAIELYDKDGNGQLSPAELAACPGMLGHLGIYDTDKSGSVSQQEIEQRISQLRQSRTGLTSLRIRVRLNGKPLAHAKVKLVPETYLGEEVKAASGTTNGRGSATMDIKDEDLSATEKGLIGVHYGTYKIEVTHPTIAIPAKFNTHTTLGYETQQGNPNFTVDLRGG
jgi:hypothetical protein